MIKITNMSYHPGYSHYINQPFFFFSISGYSPHNLKNEILEFDTVMNQFLPAYSSSSIQRFTFESINHRVAILIDLFYKEMNYPMLSNIILQFHNNIAHYYVPILGSELKVIKQFIIWIINILNGNHRELQNNFLKLSRAFKLIMPRGQNPYRILQLSHENNIPWKVLDGNIFQLGWGRKSRLMDSTTTDQTSLISMKLARDKTLTKKLLASVGLPIARSFIIYSRDEAIKMAKELGYPVVIKPANKDGGQGVSAGLSAEKYVLNAYEKARKISSEVMIEKHFEGNDHRLHILNGRLYYAAHRVAPTIAGNGKDTIRFLIQKLNESRKKPVDYGTTISTKLITHDEELEEILEEQNYHLNSILESGKKIKLRRIANVSTGGTSTRIEDLSIIHKDNVELAIKAVNTLRLDIAAVDLLIPDITKSWREVGAIITEVNAKPQVGNNDVLCNAMKMLLKEDGRIPTVLVIGDNNIQFNKNIVKKTKKEDFNIGITTNEKVYKNNRVIADNLTLNAYRSGTMIVNDPSIDAMIMYIENYSMLSEGLAIDKFDILVLLDNTQKIQSYFKEVAYLSRMTSNIFVDKNIKIDKKLLINLNEEVKLLDSDEIENNIVELFTEESKI